MNKPNDNLSIYLNSLYDMGYRSVDENAPLPQYEIEYLTGMIIQATPPTLFPQLSLPNELIDLIASYMIKGHDIDIIGEILDKLTDMLVREYKDTIKRYMGHIDARSKIRSISVRDNRDR